MHPTTREYLIKASQDDTRRDRERGRLLQQARHARHASAHQPRHPAPALPPVGRKQRNTAIRMRPKLAAAAAAVLTLTASAGAAASLSGTAAVQAAARHAAADNRFTELLALNQVKRAVAWATVERAWAGQPHTGSTRFIDQRALGQVKRQAAWKSRAPRRRQISRAPSFAPVLHLRHLSSGTLFQTYARSFDRVWDQTRSIWTGQKVTQHR
jgi:hypothetical protein